MPTALDCPARARTAPARKAPALATFALAAAALAACGGAGGAAAPNPTPAPTRTFATAGALLDGMRTRYAGQWYRTLTFTQRTTLVSPDGRERHQTWYEALALPGRLRIDRDSTLRTGTLFAADSQFSVRDGRVIAAVPGFNPLLVLGFDVYAQPTARTSAALRGLGFPAGPVRADAWEGRPVWVVGGAPGDLHSPQYWVDQERLVFVRLLQPVYGDTARTSDFRFGGYQRAGGGWVATRVEGYTGGTRTLLEEYEGVRADVALDPALFDPRRWTSARHWRR